MSAKIIKMSVIASEHHIPALASTVLPKLGFNTDEMGPVEAGYFILPVDGQGGNSGSFVESVDAVAIAANGASALRFTIGKGMEKRSFVVSGTVANFYIAMSAADNTGVAIVLAPAGSYT